VKTRSSAVPMRWLPRESSLDSVYMDRIKSRAVGIPEMLSDSAGVYLHIFYDLEAFLLKRLVNTILRRFLQNAS
jgi:hypothetical protein